MQMKLVTVNKKISKAAGVCNEILSVASTNEVKHQRIQIEIR